MIIMIMVIIIIIMTTYTVHILHWVPSAQQKELYTVFTGFYTHSCTHARIHTPNNSTPRTHASPWKLILSPLIQSRVLSVCLEVLSIVVGFFKFYLWATFQSRSTEQQCFVNGQFHFCRSAANCDVTAWSRRYTRHVAIKGDHTIFLL